MILHILNVLDDERYLGEGEGEPCVTMFDFDQLHFKCSGAFVLIYFQGNSLHHYIFSPWSQ